MKKYWGIIGQALAMCLTAVTGYPGVSADTEVVDDIGRIVPVSELSLIDVGYAERIRTMMSADEMVVLGVYPVGEDSAESMKRFFLCDGRYHAEFYLADYITGEIINLGRSVPGIDISYYVRDDDDQLITAYYDWEIQIEDYDGNGEPDILLVLSFPEKGSGFSRTGGVLLWLQKQGSFQPVNRSYCGYYSEWRESEFSLKIEELEENLREGQKPSAWKIDKVSAWVRDELLEGQTESLDKELENPKKQLSYDQWREPRNLHPELTQDAQGHYSVRIEGNPYSENLINEWLKDFYENDEEAEKEFMGVDREDEETMTQQEMWDADYYYGSSVWSTRADDAVVSLITHVYTYASGAAHGNDFTHSVVFDTRSGEVLKLVDVVENKERFSRFVVDYIESNYESVPWGIENVKDALLQEDWCFSDYGFEVFWNGGNGLGTYGRAIPYELLLGYLKEEYFPISRVTEYGLSYWDYNQTEGRILMDVNADGEVDTLVISALEGKSIKLSVNETVSELDPQFQGKPLSEQKPRIWSAMLERQEDGLTKLNLTVSIWSDKEEQSYWHVYVYRIEGECAILETEYEVEEQY